MNKKTDIEKYHTLLATNAIRYPFIIKCKFDMISYYQ